MASTSIIYIPSNFLVSNTPSYGNCYTFNSELNSEDTFAGLRLNAITGPEFGLMLVLNLQQSTYMTGGQTKQASSNHLFLFNCCTILSDLSQPHKTSLLFRIQTKPLIFTLQCNHLSTLSKDS